MLVLIRQAQAAVGRRTTVVSAKTRQLIQGNTTFFDIAESLPVFKLDADFVTNLDGCQRRQRRRRRWRLSLQSELCISRPTAETIRGHSRA